MSQTEHSKEEKETSVIFGKPVSEKKAVAVGTILGIVCGLVVVGILALIIL